MRQVVLVTEALLLLAFEPVFYIVNGEPFKQSAELTG
jgi:hypothetical protein